MIPQRRLGQSDIFISPIGLGCWQFSEGYSLTGTYWPALSEPLTNEIVQASLDGGINWFDTAEAYGWGRSEAGLSRALKKASQTNDSVVVATKWFPILRTARSIRKSIDKRLRHLDGFSIDLHQIHAPFGSLSSHRSQLNALADLVKNGKIKTVGISNFSATQMEKAFRFLESKNIPLVSNQVQYSLLNRGIEQNGIMDKAKELGITIIAYSPLAQGVLTGKFHKQPDLIKQRVGPRKRMGTFSPAGLAKSQPLIDLLETIAGKYQASVAEIALCWLLQFHGDAVVAIPGATKTQHAQLNAQAMNIQLTEEELAQIDRTSMSLN